MNAQPCTRPQHYTQNRAPSPRNAHPYQAPYNTQSYVPQYNPRSREPFKRNQFTPIGESYSGLFQKLVRRGLLQPVATHRPNPESPLHRADARCEYHSGVVGHSTEDCWTLKRVVEDLTEAGKIVLLDEEAPDVTNSLLPSYNEEFDPALKAIAAIDEIEEKSKTVAKPESSLSYGNLNSQSCYFSASGLSQGLIQMF